MLRSYLFIQIWPTIYLSENTSLSWPRPISGFGVFSTLHVNLKELNIYFSVQEPMEPIHTHKTSNNWKIYDLIKQIHELSWSVWSIEFLIAIDDKTAGFKKIHQDERWITHHIEGYGF